MIIKMMDARTGAGLTTKRRAKSMPPQCHCCLHAGLDYTTGSGNATKWLFFCGSNSDCPSGYSCLGSNVLKSAGGICGSIGWCAPVVIACQLASPPMLICKPTSADLPNLPSPKQCAAAALRSPLAWHTASATHIHTDDVALLYCCTAMAAVLPTASW